MKNDSKIILLLDNCHDQSPAEDLKTENISVTFLSPNVTSLIQTMDQEVIQNITPSLCVNA